MTVFLYRHLNSSCCISSKLILHQKSFLDMKKQRSYPAKGKIWALHGFKRKSLLKSLRKAKKADFWLFCENKHSKSDEWKYFQRRAGNNMGRKHFQNDRCYQSDRLLCTLYGHDYTKIWILQQFLQEPFSFSQQMLPFGQQVLTNFEHDINVSIFFIYFICCHAILLCHVLHIFWVISHDFTFKNLIHFQIKNAN